MTYYQKTKPNTIELKDELVAQRNKLQHQLNELDISIGCDHDWQVRTEEEFDGYTMAIYEVWFCSKCRV